MAERAPHTPLVDRVESIPLEDRQKFLNRSFDILESLRNNPEQQHLWEKFRFTYEERRKQHWLGESNADEVAGLSEGFKNVLREFSNEQRPTDSVRIHPIDPKFMRDLDSALQLSRINALESENDSFVIHRTTSNVLIGRNINLLEISDEELKESLIKGITTYNTNTFARGYSGDPW